MDTYKTVREVRERIENETNATDMLVHEIADHGVRNIIHWIDYSDEEAEELQALAEAKIRALEAV